MCRCKKRITIFVAVGVALAVLVVVVRQQYVLPVAMYHMVLPKVPENNRLAVSAQTFDRQMRFLKNRRYQVIPFGDVYRSLSGHRRLPARAVVLTFDDGTVDNYTYAFPILKKYRLPATIFLVVSEIGKPGRLSWDQIKEMQDSGLITFGSHTQHHLFLNQVGSLEILHQEVDGSKKILEERLGRPVDIFSYPMGVFNSTVRDCVRDAGYKAAVVTNPGKRCPNNDILAIKRLRISENAANLFVFWFELSGYYNFIRENRHK